MTQLNSSSNVKVGTEVITSGLDDVSTVRMFQLGTVDSVIDYEGNHCTIWVKPYADFDKFLMLL